MREFEEIIQEIDSTVLKNKTINSLTLKIIDLGTSPSIKNIKYYKELSFWLYIYGHKDLSFKLCKKFNTETFSENFDFWSSVEFIIALEARMCKEMNDDNSARECVEIIKRVYADERNPRIKTFNKALSRRLDGGLLKFEKINEAQQSNDFLSEISWRYSHFCELVLMKELGGSELWNEIKIEDEIQYNLTILGKDCVVTY